MRTIIPFCNDWLFTKPGEECVPVTLPHTWNNLDGQDGGGDYWRGECVYEKTFAAPDRKANEEVYLEFDGVYASARVTLNDHFIGEHHGGYDALQKAGIPCKFAAVEGAAHGDDLFYQDEMTDQVISFLNRLSGKGE